MKKTLSLILFSFLFFSVMAVDQDFEIQVLDDLGEKHEYCACEHTEAKRIKLRVLVKDELLEYDKIEFRYIDTDNNKVVYSDVLSGKELKARSNGQGYFDQPVYEASWKSNVMDAMVICSQKKPYNLKIEVYGSFITGYTIVHDEDESHMKPAYGREMILGMSNQLEVNPSEVTRDRVREKKVARGFLSFLAGVMGALWATLTMN